MARTINLFNLSESPGVVTVNKVSHGDWIPCKERLPDMHDAGILKRQGVNQISDICIVTITDGTKLMIDSNCRLKDGVWSSEKLSLLSSTNKKCEVVAWMPLPEPYKG